MHQIFLVQYLNFHYACSKSEIHYDYFKGTKKTTTMVKWVNIPKTQIKEYKYIQSV